MRAASVGPAAGIDRGTRCVAGRTAASLGSVASMNARRNGSGGYHRERRCEREIIVERIDVDASDDGCQCECGFQHGEVVSDAGARAATEWKVLPTVTALRTVWTESARIELQRIVPQPWIPLYRHASDRQHGAGLDTIAGNLDIANCHPCPGRPRRAQPQRFLKNLNRKAQPRNIIGSKLTIAEFSDFDGDDFGIRVVGSRSPS